MKPTDLLKENTPPHILFFGGPGSGKTALAAQAYRCKYLDLDNGMLTAAKLQDAFTKYRHQVDFDRFLDTKLKKATAFIETKKKIIDIVNAIYAKRFDYDGVILDSLTSLSKACQLSVLLASQHPRLTLPDWGLVVSELEQILKILVSLPTLVIVTAHEEVYTQDEVTKSRPYVSGQKLPNYLPALFDEVLYCDVRKIAMGAYQYYVTGQKTPTIMARTRSGLTERFVHATTPATDSDCGLKGVFERMQYKYFE